MKLFLKKHAIDISLAIFVLTLLLYILFWKGTIGLSDNGDYGRVMSPNGISYISPTDERAFLFNKEYRMEFDGKNVLTKITNNIFLIKNPKHYPSIQHVFIKLAMLGNVIVNLLTNTDIHTFRIGILGIIYSGLYAISLFALFTAINTGNKIINIIIKAAIIAVACDIGYVAYFNSFYGEALQIIFFVSAVAFGLRLINGPNIHRADVVLFYSSLIIFGWSKFANLPYAILAAVFCLLGLCFFKEDKKLKRFATAAGSLSIICLIIVYLIVPKWMDTETTYNTVFFGVLRDTGRAQSEQYLKELGLPNYMLELADSNYYMKRVGKLVTTGEFKKDFSKVSKFDVGIFYIKHPAYFFEKLNISSYNSSIIRPAYLSNFGLEKPRISFSKKFELWGELRKNLPFNRLWWNFAVCLGFTACSVIIAMRKRKSRFNFRLLLFCGFAAVNIAGWLINLSIPVITNGQCDIGKHMLSFIQLVDFMCLSIFIVGMHEVYKYAECKIKKGQGMQKPIAALIALIFISYAAASSFMSFEISKLSKIKSHNAIEVGSFVKFGSYRHKDLIWQVVEINKEEITLLSNKIVETGAFSDSISDKGTKLKFGSNLWPESKIRKWLNTDFLNDFNSKEYSIISNSNIKYLLSTGNTSVKRGGDNEFFWSPVPQLADSGYDRAYYSYCADKAFLPEINLICDAKRKGLNICKDMPYWLRTPYFNDDSMVRVVEEDGYIYMKDANTDAVGITPAIRLAGGLNYNGKGSLSDPFTVKYDQ